jgi:hypothetical protein
MREAGLSELTPERLIELHNHEVSPDFVEQIRQAGLVDIDVQQIIALSEREVDPELLRAMHGTYSV